MVVFDAAPVTVKHGYINGRAVFQLADDIISGAGVAAHIERPSIFGIDIHGSLTADLLR